MSSFQGDFSAWEFWGKGEPKHTAGAGKRCHIPACQKGHNLKEDVEVEIRKVTQLSRHGRLDLISCL